MSDSTTPLPKKSSKTRDKTSSSEKTNRSSRSNSNVSVPQIIYSTSTNNEEMQPLIRKVNSARQARISLVMNCTLCVSIIVLVAALMTLGISIIDLNVDDSFNIEAGVAVSSIEGRVRSGSGFSFVYQRATDDSLPSFPLQVQTFSFFPQNPTLVLVYNSNNDGRIFTTIIDDKAIISNRSQFATINPPYLFDAQAIDSHRFFVLYADQINQHFQYLTNKLYIVLGTINEDVSVMFDKPYVILEEQQSLQIPPPLYAFIAALPNDYFSIMYHRQSKEVTGCMNYLVRYFANNQTWTTVDSLFLSTPCRTGNVSPLSDSNVVIATESDIRVVDYDQGKINVISSIVKFTCKPSYLVRTDPGEAITASQIDIKATSSHGFLLSCTWFKSAAALYGVVRWGNGGQIELGDFIEFDNVVPGTVQLSGPFETISRNKENKYSIFATYRSQQTGLYQTIRCGTMETYKGFFVSFSKPYVHKTYSPSDVTSAPDNATFTTSVDVSGVSRYGIMFVSSSKPQGGVNGIFELELAKWNGGIKWVGISVSDSDKTTGTTKIVQKGLTWGHQGLIPGSGYFADVNGQLTLSKTDTYVGIARSSSEIMIDENFVN